MGWPFNVDGLNVMLSESSFRPEGRHMPRPMSDLVVVVPGILGSELRKDDRLVWGFPEGVRGLLRIRSWLRESAAQLELKRDHPTEPYLDDGVRATSLVSVPQVVANFIKTDGYDLLRERLLEAFQLQPVSPDAAGNYLEFPYDWRRDNWAAAHRLHTAVNEALGRWREETGNREAKAIYICHSMGGLVARYHLEALGGWPECRALITLATPHRGAVTALDYLATGYTTAGVDLTAVLRSCTSVYQLLPVYGVIDAGGGKFDRVAERGDIPNVSQARTQEARRFHDEILAAVAARPPAAYPIFYFSGVAQPTLQSATLAGVAFKAERSVPDDFPTYRETGDGTVPYVSSIPYELSKEPRGAFVFPTCHAVMQSSEAVWGTVVNAAREVQRLPVEKCSAG
jgi:pimeloyl-ACP methyl ester carboxylesterase